MPTLEFASSFEDTSWADFDTVSANAPVADPDAAFGADAVRIAQNNAACYVRRDASIPAGLTIGVYRFYIKVNAVPSASTTIMTVKGTATGSFNPRFEVTTGGKLQAGANAYTGTSRNSANALNDGLWHLVDARLTIDSPGGNVTWDWMVDGVAQTQYTGSGAPAGNTISQEWFGSTSTTVTQDTSIDAYDVSRQSGDYPIGAMPVLLAGVAASVPQAYGAGQPPVIVFSGQAVAAESAVAAVAAASKVGLSAQNSVTG